MATQLTTQQWNEILNDEELTRTIDLEIFQCYYSMENFTASSKKAGKILGYGDKSPQAVLNAEFGRYAKRIATKFEINLTQRENKKYKFWDLFFNGSYSGQTFQWTLKETLVKALEESNLVSKFVLPDEITKGGLGEPLYEGLKKTISVNSFERNPKAREQCINHFGAKCQVCEIEFSKVYGEIGNGYIHVHHKYQIAYIGEEYQIDPIKDLIPICPNCHAMIHRTKPMLTVEQLKLKMKGAYNK